MQDRDSRPKQMTLKELMQLAYNAGYEDGKEQDPVLGFSGWWKAYGEDRHDDYEHWKTYGYDRNEKEGP